jgi:uncharacterized linocin/CFP29 family protein
MSGAVSIQEFRANRPLPENAQKLIDDAVVRVGLDRLTIAADIMAAGLTYPVDEAWGVMQVQWDEISKAGGATRAMNPRARGESNLIERQPRSVPLWVTFDEFDLGIRTLTASQRVGQPLDVTMIEEATRRVNEALEDAVINGIDTKVFGSDVPGLLTAPNVNTTSISAWTGGAITGDDILTDVLAMVQKAHDARRFGPYNLYVPTAYDLVLNKNFNANYPGTIRDRLQQIQSGGRTLVVKAADQLPSNKVVLVQMTREIVDIVDGMQPEVITWEDQGGLALNWMVAAIQVPRVKSDFADKSGIVVATAS